MNRPYTHAIALSLIVSVPFAWLACGGGENKPAESPSSENEKASTSSEDSGASAASTGSAASSSAPAAEATSTASATAEATTASTPPPPPSLGSTDCGSCLDKTCSKQMTACGKNSDCQSALDSIHGCTSGAATCIDGATAPTAAKPKKLAAAYETCAKKALAKACKAKCQ
jgi:hypothetical protein